MTIIDGPRRADAYAFHGQASLIEDTTAAVHHLNGKYLHANSIGRVGIELEAHCIDLKDPHRRPTWAEICDVVGSLPALPGGSRVTLEPGGAVELSGPPLPSAAHAIAAMVSDRAVLRAEFSNAGMGLALLGTDPLRAPVRVNPGRR
jgi:glutamate--cysteine ligase